MSQVKKLAEIIAANKAGMTDKGYCTDKYARHFVSKVVHYSPIVHKDVFIKNRCVETIVMDVLLHAKKVEVPIRSQHTNLSKRRYSLCMKISLKSSPKNTQIFSPKKIQNNILNIEMFLEVYVRQLAMLTQLFFVESW